MEYKELTEKEDDFMEEFKQKLDSKRVSKYTIEKLLDKLVENKIRPDIVDCMGDTLLHYFAEYCHGLDGIMEIQGKVTEILGANINMQNFHQKTPLIVAVESLMSLKQIQWKIPVVKILLNIPGVDINLSDAHGDTALHKTIELLDLESENPRNGYDIVRLLCKKDKEGIDIHAINRKCIGPYAMAKIRYSAQEKKYKKKYEDQFSYKDIYEILLSIKHFQKRSKLTLNM